jgi:hypothetical protein
MYRSSKPFVYTTTATKETPEQYKARKETVSQHYKGNVETPERYKARKGEQDKENQKSLKEAQKAQNLQYELQLERSNAPKYVMGYLEKREERREKRVQEDSLN